ncbi:MAG: hypothetical protein SVP26_01580 [Chloroflexota bacterium]|nr:hypothetical protein [Chloroflexota bacterium]
MKRIASLRRDQGGYILGFVLALVVVVAIIVVPLLLFMSSGIMSSHRHEDWMSTFYAADAGIEDATHKVQNESDDLPTYDDAPLVYEISDINGCNVEVSIESLWILDGLETSAHGTTPHAELAVVGHIIDLGGDTGTLCIEMTYDGSLPGLLKVDKVGAWLPGGFSYVPDSSGGITSHDDVPDNPTESGFRGGTALEWEFTAPSGVKFEELPPPGGGGGGSAEFPIKRLLYFDFTPAEEPKGEFSWLRTTRHDIYLAWDIDSDIFKVNSTAVSNETGGDTSLEAYIGGSELYEAMAESYGDYRAVGNSLMQDTNSDRKRDELLYHAADVKASITDIPEGATIELAYLYWSAWRRYPYDIRYYQEDELAELADEIDQAEFGTKASGGSWEEQNIEADRTWIRANVDSSGYGHGWSFSCRADVTDEVSALGTPNASYKVSRIWGLDDWWGLWYHHTGEYYWSTDDEWSYAGWSLVVVYSHPDEDAHQLYLYDDFLYMDMYDTITLDGIEGFLVPDLEGGDEGARLTMFVGEGDDVYNDDWIEFEGNRLPHEDDPYDGVNPQNDVWNGKSSGLDGEFIDGVDIDTFDATPYVTQGQTEAEVRLGTWSDSWNLIYSILSFRTEPGTNPSLLPVGILTYHYD